MRPIIISLPLLAVVTISPSQAQLVLEKSVSPKKAEQFVRSIPLKEFDGYIQKYGAPYVYEGGGIPEPPTAPTVTSQTEYAWRFRNRDVFYSYITTFRTDLDPPPLCQHDTPHDKALDTDSCERAIRNFSKCHLFIFDANRHLAAVQPLKIPQPYFMDAKPACFDVYAMAPAQIVKDGMLIVAGYYDSRWRCYSGTDWACTPDDPVGEPDPLYKTTFLVRFDRDAEGKLVLSQDDHCLPPLNSHATIASARQALREAGCR